MAGIAWQHPVTLALTDIGEARRGEVKLALMVDLGKDREAFAVQLDGLVAALAASDESARPREATIGQVSVRQIGPPQAGVTFGYIGNMFFATMGPGAAEALVEPGESASLAKSAKFIQTMRQVDGVNGEALQMLLYVDAAAIAAKLKPKAPAEAATQPAAGAEQVDDAAKLLDAFGVDGVTTVAGSWRIVEKGMLSTFRVNTPRPHEGLMSLFDGQALTDADLAVVPADADLALVANIEPVKVFEQLRRGVGIAAGDEGVQEFDANVLAFEKMLEISLKDDLLASLGDTWSISMADSQGGLLTGLMLSVEVRDEQKLVAVLERVSNMAAGMILGQQMQRREQDEAITPPIQSLQVGGARVQYLRIPGNGAQLAFLPAWCVHNKRLYLAGWPQTIASALTSDAKPLTVNAEFKRLGGKLPANASWISWTNTPQLMRKFYPLCLVAGTIATNAIVNETHTLAIPPLWPAGLAEMTKYTWPSASVIVADDGGITVQGYSSGPTLLPGGVAGVSIGVSVALPALSKARYLAKKAVSAANLNGIGKGCVLYAGENDDRFPATVDDLVAAGQGPKLFVSPLSGRPAPQWDRQRQRLQGDVDYILIDYSGLGSDAGRLPSSLLLAYERPENYRPGDRICVLYADAHVTEIPPEDLPEMIEAAKQAGGKLPAAAHTPGKHPAKPRNTGLPEPPSQYHFWDTEKQQEYTLTAEGMEKHLKDGAMAMETGELMYSPLTKKNTGVPMTLCPQCKKYFVPQAWANPEKGWDPDARPVCAHCGTDLHEWYRKQRLNR
jgi:hypothetical protein